MTDSNEALAVARGEAVAHLADLRREYDGIVASMAAAGTDDEHDPDGSTLAFERAQARALVEQAQRRVAELDHALVELAAGRYGRCERCGRDIGTERLAARPTAVTCIDCAQLTR